MLETTLTRRIFFKGTQSLEKDITLECANAREMTNEEFESLFSQIYNSSMYFACNARYVSAQKAAELCKIAGFEYQSAYDNLRRHYENLWNYTGD